jgi:putative oxidoreductase
VGLARFIARPMLASIFLVGGADAFAHPERRAEQAKPVIEQMTSVLPALPPDPVVLVKANAAMQVGAAALLSAGVLQRLSALVLAASLVPTTFGGHRFWELQDPAARAQQRTHFLKNTAILGGLLLIALD